MKEHESGMSSALQTIETSSPSAPKTGLGAAVTSMPAAAGILRAALRTTRAKGRADAAILVVVALLLERNCDYREWR